MDRKTARLPLRVLNQLFGGPPGPGFAPPAICAIIRLGNRPLFDRTIAAAKKGRSILSHFVLSVVSTTLEATDPPEDFEVRLSELIRVSRVEGPRHTPAQQGLNNLGRQRRTFGPNLAVGVSNSSGPNRMPS